MATKRSTTDNRPQVFKITELGASKVHTEIRGQWVPARYVAPWHSRGFFYRLKLAWAVFCGRYDVLDWEIDP